MKLDSILEEAWRELEQNYMNGYIFLNEEDMRCHLYHLCAKRLSNLNYIHSQVQFGEKEQKHDLVLECQENGQKIAVELKCWLLKSSGAPNRVQKIQDQFRRLENAIKLRGFNQAYLFILDEFELHPDYKEKLIPNEEQLKFIYFSPKCLKINEKWKIEKERQPCSNCKIKIPCQINQKYLENWQSKGYMK